ncbi:MAG: SURF1 family protein [Actinobacteria bacterium]|nr:SURF1 family protein [Actinomycetota bacterium]
MARYRFLLSFRWIVLTVLVAFAVFTMVRLGEWQLDRLQGRRAANAVIDARQTSTPVPLASLARPGASQSQIDETLWRQVTVTGTYRTDDQVLIRNRSNNTAPGFWVITPVVTSDGTAVAVNRGWIPVTVADGGSPDQYAPPTGEVTVTGVAQRPEQRRGLEVADPDGKQARLSRVDIDRLQQQVPYGLAPVWVQMRAQQPAQAGVLPVKVEPPALDDGSHLNYAGQWFIYAGLTLVIYPMAIRRAAKSREAKARQAAEGDEPRREDEADRAKTASAAV